MAVTKTDYVVSAGFTTDDFFTALGQALTSIGVLGGPTSWDNSWEDADGTYRVFSQTVGTGLRSKIYHMFAKDKAGGRLFYTHFFQWNVNTQQSDGSNYYDFVYTYRDFNWANPIPYYCGVADLVNVSDFTVSALANSSGNTGWLWLHNASESRVIGFLTGNPTTRPGVPATWDDLSPTIGMYALHTVGQRVVITHALTLKADIFCGWNNAGSGSNDFAASTSQTGLKSGGNQQSAYEIGEMGGDIYGRNFQSTATTSTKVMTEGYRGFFNNPMLAPLFDGVHTGDVGCILGQNDELWSPNQGDTLVVTAGVEEYLVLKSILSTSVSFSPDWAALVARVI